MPKPVTSRKRPADKTRMWSERYWHEYQYDENRPKTPEFLADFSFASAEHQWLEFVNLVSGRQDAPEFCLAGEEETRADKVAFEKFLDSHFPRGKEKFRELRRALDLLARGKITMMAAKPYSPIQNYPFLLERGMEFFTRGKTPIQGVQTCPQSVYTPIRAYHLLVEQRKFLRSLSRYGNYFARMTGNKRPALQICEACGKLFLARRKDALTCSENCSAARRVARARARAKEMKRNQKQTTRRSTDTHGAS